MALCLNTAQINNYFAAVRNQFADPIYQKLFREDPFMSVIPRAMYDYNDGLQPTALTSTTALPTAYPDNLAVLGSLSNGSSTSCDVPTTIINDGTLARTFQLEQQAFQSRTLCLTDLQFDWQAGRQASNLMNSIVEYGTVFQSDWTRVKNICMINRKVSTGSGSTLNMSLDSNCDFSGVPLPTDYLTWDDLNTLYDIQIRAGLRPNAVGFAEGQPLASLVLGPGYKRRLFQYDPQTRDTVNWGDAFQNFTARGIFTSINGYVPNLDDYPIRYAANGTTKIYPTINIAGTTGSQNIPNPNYLTVANGGQAVYEVVTILPRNVYEIRVRQSDPTSFGGMSFTQRSFAGDIYWVNNRDMCDNIDGNKGFYRQIYSMAAKPVFPDLGASILTLAVDGR